ncbi:MAG: S46 family peptidase [Pirellulaceae bacterium]|nr:S46 family peptidase [Pirellulaceae bacterium]
MAIPCAPANADEGMWLFNALPKNYLKDTYDFTVTDEWANHIMLSSVRFNSGGSASFVSSNGLVLTNHHVGAETLHKLSDADNNYYKDGFYAKTMSDEIKAPDLELNQLVSISDVTAKVNGVVKPGMNAGAAAAARRAAIAKIENDSLEETKLRSNVVTLYGGARYHLYRYKKYTDVRLVWSPESAIAFFGGDADNFEYPRYCLDVCIFRVYENDEPAKVEHFLKVSKKGAGDGELVLVSGNPGRTQRIFTVAALKHQRDHRMPYVLDFLRRREILFQQFSLESDEKKRRGQDELFGLQNSRKAFTGMLKGLQNPSIIADKQKKEDQLRRAVGANPRLKKYATAWQQIEEVQARRLAIQGQTGSFASRRFDIAMELVLLAAEDAKPNEKRLPQYRDSNRESLEQQLFSPAPIYDDVELVKFADSIELFVERRGGDNELVRLVLDGQSPSNLAAAVLNKTKLADIDERKRLAKSGAEGISASKDPMIRLALIMEPEFRRLRKVGDELNEVERQAYSQIADALFAVQGASTYPDATFTLRLAYGPVKGYEEGGQRIPPWTTMGGAFDHEKRHNAKDDWQLPKSWKDRKDKLNLDTPFNFVCTADIIGGNSGSPVVNRAGELVGVIFDGNIQSLTADYMYSDEQGRATSVHSSAVIEALRKIYDAKKLADQLGN